MITKLNEEIIGNKEYSKIGLFISDERNVILLSSNENTSERLKNKLNDSIYEISYDCIDYNSDGKNGKYIVLLFKKEYYDNIYKIIEEIND